MELNFYKVEGINNISSEKNILIISFSAKVALVLSNQRDGEGGICGKIKGLPLQHRLRLEGQMGDLWL